VRVRRGRKSDAGEGGILSVRLLVVRLRGRRRRRRRRRRLGVVLGGEMRVGSVVGRESSDDESRRVRLFDDERLASERRRVPE